VIVRLLAMGSAVTLLAAAGVAQERAPRSVVPIREVVIPDGGGVRYTVIMTVNRVPVQVGLDTGSTGLRLLPRAVKRARVVPGEQPEQYSYDSGVLLQGRRATARVAFGSASAPVTIQAIDQVACTRAKPHCPASRVPAASYGLMGSGRAGAGFRAIVGIRLRDGRIPNPMAALGIRRWIVHLPQRGQGHGALILNPDARDMAGFVTLQPGAGGENDKIGACLMTLRSPADRVCGPTLLDTGAPGLVIANARPPRSWAANVLARIGFIPAAGGPVPAVLFRTGDHANGGSATFRPRTTSTHAEISAGTLPFYAYDVLFDGKRGTIALRPNLTAGPAVRPVVGGSR
jgi:hypothetical protein